VQGLSPGPGNTAFLPPADSIQDRSLNLWSLAPVPDNEAVQEVSQYLIAAFFIVSVVRFPEKSGEFRFRSLKTRKLQDLNNISIFKFQRDSEFFQYVIIGHGLSIVFPGFSALPLY